jgi:hypothetical protein
MCWVTSSSPSLPPNAPTSPRVEVVAERQQQVKAAVNGAGVPEGGRDPRARTTPGCSGQVATPHGGAPGRGDRGRPKWRFVRWRPTNGWLWEADPMPMLGRVHAHLQGLTLTEAGALVEYHLEQAAQAKCSYAGFLADLRQAEVDARRHASGDSLAERGDGSPLGGGRSLRNGDELPSDYRTSRPLDAQSRAR